MKNPNIIFITGASSGLGRALALAYAAPGKTLLLTGRDATRLEETSSVCKQKGAVVEIIVVDVIDKGALEKQILLWDDTHPIDLVIANAGISGGSGGPDGESDAQLRRIMATNLDGVFNTVNPLISRMTARKKGQVALMSSLAGLRGLPSAPAYSVSKVAVRAYGEALRPLLGPEGVEVNVICPGFIRTPMTAVNDFPMPFLVEPEKAAENIKRGLAGNKARIAFPWPLYFILRLIASLPLCLADFILGRAPKKPAR